MTSSQRVSLLNRVSAVDGGPQARDMDLSKKTDLSPYFGLRDNDHFNIGGEGSIRIAANGHMPIAMADDPLTLLQEGLPVLFWDGSNFSHRVMKVDDVLCFFYLIVDESFGGKVNSAVVKQEVLAVRLNRISRIYVGGEALRICEIMEVQDHHLTVDSALVIQTGTVPPNEAPKVEQVVVLMLSPTSMLRVCLENALVKAPEHDPLSHDNKIAKGGGANLGGKLSTSKMKSLAAKPKSMLRVVKARIKDPEAIFNKNAKTVELECTIRSEGRKGAGGMDLHVNQTVPIEMDPASIESELQKVEQKMNQTFVPVDEARVSNCITEALALRQWANKLSSQEGFSSGINTFVNDAEALGCVVHQDECFAAVHRTVAQPDTARYGELEGASVRSACRALENMMNLEQVFAHIMRMGSSQNIFGLPRRVTLSGEIMPDGLDDEDAGEEEAGLASTPAATASKEAIGKKTDESSQPLLTQAAAVAETQLGTQPISQPPSCLSARGQLPACISSRDTC